MENEELPQYMRIAGSVAGRIAEGQFAEGEKLSGRSKLSSEYQVSPETIRKAVQLLREKLDEKNVYYMNPALIS